MIKTRLKNDQKIIYYCFSIYFAIISYVWYSKEVKKKVSVHEWFTFISQMQIMFVQSRSDNVNTSLSENREHIEKLNKKCNLLRKIQVLNVTKQCYVFLVTHYILFFMFDNFVGFSLLCWLLVHQVIWY
jgi:hypothetical protein